MSVGVVRIPGSSINPPPGRIWVLWGSVAAESGISRDGQFLEAFRSSCFSFASINSGTDEVTVAV
jgi:hypothetical protein